MNFHCLLACAGLAVATGCAVPSEPAGADEAEVSRRATVRIELPQSSSAASLQAKLFHLLDAFRSDPEVGVVHATGSSSLRIVGAPALEAAPRSVACSTSEMEAVAPGGDGFTSITFYGCTLDGFAQVRDGGVLPEADVPFAGEAPLAAKLFTLLAKGAKKGGLGVEQTRSSDDVPPCCDMLYTDTFAISDADATLSCSMTTGGIAGIHVAECAFTQNDPTRRR